jgi:hypothetical protein
VKVFGSLILATMAATGCGRQHSDGGSLPTTPSASVPSLPTGQLPRPSQLPPISGRITIASAQPASGATIRARDCSSRSGGESICTEELRLSFDVVVSHDLADATLMVNFLSDTQDCGVMYIPGIGLSAGVVHTAGGGFTSLSYVLSEGDDSTAVRVPPCSSFPISTNRLVLRLWARGNSAVPVMTQEIPLNYTFVQ